MEVIKQAIIIPASPKQIYELWLSSTHHSELTGDTAFINPVVGGSYYAFDGYIKGENLELTPYSKIIQSWIADEEDWIENHTSKITLELIPFDGGTTLRFTHEDVPPVLKEKLADGWMTYYWQPLQDWFNGYNKH